MVDIKQDDSVWIVRVRGMELALHTGLRTASTMNQAFLCIWDRGGACWGGSVLALWVLCLVIYSSVF